MMRLVLVFFPLKGLQKPSETDRMGPKVNAWKHHMALVDNLQLTQGTMTKLTMDQRLVQQEAYCAPWAPGISGSNNCTQCTLCTR